MENTEMNGKYKPYQIFEKDGLKIGVFGLGIELRGLVPETLYKETRYIDPIRIANETAAKLKNELACDYVICLSHLGYKYDENKVSDVVLAERTEGIDFIIGGHTHTFLKEAIPYKNKNGGLVYVNQVGYAGINLGRLDVFFERNKPGKCITCKNMPI